MVDLSLPSPTTVTSRLSGTSLAWLTAICLIAVLLVPLTVAEVPPLLDYPNHLARAHIIATIDEDPLLAARYQVTWQALPNLAFDVLVPPMAQLFGVYTAGRLFLALAVVFAVLGPMVFHRALYGSYSIWPLSCGLIAYHGAFVAGFSGFSLGLGLSLLLSGWWLMLRARHPLLGLGAGLVFAFITYFTHLFALGLFGLIALSELFVRWRASARRWPPERAFVVEGLAMAVQFLPVMSLFLLSTSGESVASNTWYIAQKLNFATYMIAAVHPDFLAVFGTTLLLLGLWHLVREGYVKVHPAVVPAILVMAVLWFALPSHVLDTAFVVERLFLALIFLALAAVRPGKLVPRVERFLRVSVATMITLRIIFLTAEWHHATAAEGETRAALARIERGAVLHTSVDVQTYVAAVEGKPEGSEPFLPVWAVSINRIPALAHFGSLAVIERSAFVPLLFTHPDKQLLQAHPDFEPVDQRQGLPWPAQLLPSAIRRARAMLSGRVDAPHYVLILHPQNWRGSDADDSKTVGDRFTSLFSGRYLSLAGLLIKN